MKVEGKHPTIEENEGHGGVTIRSSEECRPQKVILEKPFMEMKRHIRPSYIRAHLNGKPVSTMKVQYDLAI